MWQQAKEHLTSKLSSRGCAVLFGAFNYLVCGGRQGCSVQQRGWVKSHRCRLCSWLQLMRAWYPSMPMILQGLVPLR
jgi:hypothetical protein